MKTLRDQLMELQEISRVTYTVDGIDIIITDVEKETLDGFIRCQCFNDDGLVYAPRDEDIVHIAFWFHQHGTKVAIRVSDKVSGLFTWLYCKFRIWRIHKLLKEGGT
jgi:hypothetical protein